MPVISGRYSTNSSSAASYLSSPSSSTYRSSYDSGRTSYSNYSTSGNTSSGYRSSSYLTSYRSGLSDSSTGSGSTSRYTSSGYGVSRDKVSSLLPPTPPSSVTNRRSESRQRDFISNKDYTPTTNSTLSSSTLKTANSLNRLSRLGSGERSSSLARNLATCGVDLYEKYSPSTYVSPSIGAPKASSYNPKTELTRSRSLSEASKYLVNNNNSLGSNDHINNINTTTNIVGDDGLVERGGDKVNLNQPLQHHQLQPLVSLTRNNNNNKNKFADCLIDSSVKINDNEFDANKNKVLAEHSLKLYNANASQDVCCVLPSTNNNNNGLKHNNNSNNNIKNSKSSIIIESYNSRLNVKNTVNNIHVINSSESVTKKITSTTTNASQPTTNNSNGNNNHNSVINSTKLNQINKPPTISLTSTLTASQSRSQPRQPNNMITNLSRNKGFMSNESLNKSHRTNTANNFNFSSYRNENFLKNECELARQEVLLANQKKQKQTLNDQLKNNSNPQLTIFDINNPDQHGKKGAPQSSGKMMNGYNTNTGKLSSRVDDDIKFIDSDETVVGGGQEASRKRIETYKNGVEATNRRHRPSETSELNKITQKILNQHHPEQRGRDKSRTISTNKGFVTNGATDEEIKFIDSEQAEPVGAAKASKTSGSLSLPKSTSPLPSSSLTNNNSSHNNNSFHHHHNHHSHNSKNHSINNIINNTKNQVITNNHKCDKQNNTKCKSNNTHLNSTSTESLTLGASVSCQHPSVAKPTPGLMEKVASPLKTSTVTVQITPKSSPSMAATTVTSAATGATAVSASPQSAVSPIAISSSTTCEDVNLTNLLIDNNKLTNKLTDESLRSTSSLRNALPSAPTTSSSLYRDRDSSTSSTYRSSNSYSDGYTPKRSTLLSSSIDRERKTSVTEHIEGLCGLWNIGNTCFMNSVVQCLSHTSELTKYLRSQTGTRSSSSERKDQRIFNEFVKLIKEMWSASSRSVNPSEFKMALSSKYRMYSGSTQQDAQEFLRFFLDSLHTAMNPAQKAEPVTIDDNMSDSKKADLMWDWYSKTENSVIKDLFVGQLRSTLKCSTCGTTSVTFDPFWDLSLPLPSNTRCKLENCLELFIKEEILDGDEMPNCAKCKTRRKSTKTFTIQRFPKYLVIHLKRFSETRWSKLTNIVEFPTGERELNLAPYASDKSVPCVYSLYGISNHMGSTAGGHYVAACKHASTKKWHEFNDNSVSDISESSLVSSSAYLLFFERVPTTFDNTNGFPHQPITVERAHLYRAVQRCKQNSLINCFRRSSLFHSNDQQTTLVGFLFYTACFVFWFFVV